MFFVVKDKSCELLENSCNWRTCDLLKWNLLGIQHATNNVIYDNIGIYLVVLCEFMMMWLGDWDMIKQLDMIWVCLKTPKQHAADCLARCSDKYEIDLTSWKHLPCNMYIMASTGWCFGTWFLWLSIQLGMSSSQLTFIFFRGVGIPPTSRYSPSLIIIKSPLITIVSPPTRVALPLISTTGTGPSFGIRS